jgi:hypothetical protein
MATVVQEICRARLRHKPVHRGQYYEEREQWSVAPFITYVSQSKSLTIVSIRPEWA